jgi:hypothetical protein
MAEIPDVYKLSYQNQTVSNPILHDLIRSFLVRDAEYILQLCSHQPEIQRSRLFPQSEACHKFVDAREEFYVNEMRGRPFLNNVATQYYPVDAVWRFGYGEIERDDKGNAIPSSNFPSYIIIHEIKTGKYKMDEELHKHYLHYNHIQFYIWGYPEFHKENPKPPGLFIKQLDIDMLKFRITKKTMSVLQDWNGRSFQGV